MASREEALMSLHSFLNSPVKAGKDYATYPRDGIISALDLLNKLIHEEKEEKMLRIEIFSAEWCGGCKVVKRALDAKGFEYSEKDIDKSEVMEEAAQLGIRGIPVTRILRGDELVESVVGASPEAVSRIIELFS